MAVRYVKGVSFIAEQWNSSETYSKAVSRGISNENCGVQDDYNKKLSQFDIECNRIPHVGGNWIYF